MTAPAPGAFSLLLPRRVVFGRGRAPEAISAARAMGARILLVRSASARFADVALADLPGAAVLTTSGEPTLPQIDAALDEARAAPPQAVLAIGGGAAIDMAKALAALIPQPGPPMRYLEVVGDGQPLDVPPLPLIALPTTAGTGAEATKNAVIGIPEHRRKVSLRDDRMLPDLALVDPALTDDCPPGVTLASGLDAVTQVIEPYLSCRANPLTDALCRDAIPRGLNALRSLMDTPTSKARDQMAYVSLSGGIALANAGLGAVHGLAGVLGGRTGMAHGAICGRLLVPILHANAAALHAAGQPAERITEIRNWVAAAFDTTPDDALAHLSDWADSHGLPYLPRVSAAELQDWAQECERASSYKANPIPLGQDRLIRALEQALPPG